MKRVSIPTMHDLGFRMSGILDLVSSNKDKNIITQEIEDYLKELMSMVAQNNILNSINLIDRVVETGEKTPTGMYKQFHVSSLELFDQTKLLLKVFQIVDYDRANMKYILSEDMTLIDFKKVSKIY
ncbi:MAG: hypothetical protein RBR23_02945 [Arcobacteraceae bacterium]|jgi:hypothetical protein|nr:hypothetical protein [Arcobacteraceae bacterium]